MKAQKRKLMLASLLLASAIFAGYVPATNAQDMLDEADDLLQDGSAVQMDDINLDGHLSPSEILRKRREKLEERNKIMVEKKIEDIRVKQEIALTNKLSDAFSKGLNNLNEDKVEVKQAAPVAPQPIIVQAPVVQPTIVETKIEAKEEIQIEKNSKAVPYVGGQSIKDGTNLDLESKLNIGLNLETKLQSNITMGIGLGYTTLTAADGANNYTNSTMICNQGYCGAREISYSKLNVGGNAKYFFSIDTKVKPYLGGSIDFNRTNLSYSQASSYYYGNGVNLGNEGYSSNFFSFGVRLGAEVDLSETYGLNFDLSYSKALTSDIASKSEVSSSYNPDQGRLENISRAMEKADVTALQAGFVIKF